MTATAKVETLSIEESVKRAEEVGILPQLAELNIFRTLLRHPKLAKVISNLLMMLLSDGNKLDARLRELLIMRIGWVTSCDYEWTQHWPIAKMFGVEEEELLAVRDWRNAGLALYQAFPVLVYIVTQGSDTPHSGNYDPCSSIRNMIHGSPSLFRKSFHKACLSHQCSVRFVK